MSHYHIAKIGYDAQRTNYPWSSTFYGKIAEQGGIVPGTTQVWHQTLAAACSYIAEVVGRDWEEMHLPLIKTKEGG